MPPIILEPSDSTEVFVKAIQQASLRNVPLLLEPGTHFTRPGRNQQIPLGANGVRISKAPPRSIPPPPPGPPAVIKRPDRSIDLERPDSNYGFFLIPSMPTAAEVASIDWRSHLDNNGNPFEFGIVIRGEIELDGLTVDCNMGRQFLERLPKNTAEHSAMIGFAGQKYAKMVDADGRTPSIPASKAGVPRFVYAGFASVTLRNIVTENGGFADDIWFSRGYFNPNIERVAVQNFRSRNRVQPSRATISFSGACQTIEMNDLGIYKLEMEDTIRQHFDEIPRRSDVFTPSTWTLTDIRAEKIDLAAKGKVYQLDARRLTATDSFFLYQAGGRIANSRLKPNQDRRLIRLDDFVFEDVLWELDTEPSGEVRGLQPTAQFDDSCEVTFRANRFQVHGNPVSGEIIASEPSPRLPDNRVTVTLIDCSYPDSFGRSPELPIARARERGDWTFALADLGDRDRDVAVQKGSAQGIVVRFV